jgi:hypothetical protein
MPDDSGASAHANDATDAAADGPRPSGADLLARVADVATFASLGVLGTTQDVTHALLADVDGADPELVAEETLCLVAVATARALEVGMRQSAPQLAPFASRPMLRLPFTYREYLIGQAMMAGGDASLAEAADAIRERLGRKLDFYTAHLPPSQFPGPRALADKMALWMGRVSPPKLPESPQDRLARLDLVDAVVAHLKVVLAFARRG